MINTLNDLGYKPSVDDDGDVAFRYQMKAVYVLGTMEEDTNYLVVILPQIYEMEEGEEIKALTACNKLTRELSFAKVYIDSTFKNVNACCEIYYCDEECLKSQLEQALNVISQVRSTFLKAMRELDE